MAQDRIIYLVKTEPGGCDGMDHTDKGGQLMLATFDRAEAEKFIGKDSRYRLEPTVVDVDKAHRTAIAKLDKLDCLILGYDAKGKRIQRGRLED